MIRRRLSRKIEEVNAEVEPKGFDDFDLRLGDLMRGERATMGKSLLDVQRDLRIKASYIAAIENCDPGSFDTPGFIAGYVRSYARYLGMDPDHAFQTFCAESGFSLAHGMSAAASSLRRADAPSQSPAVREPFSRTSTPIAPVAERLFGHVEPRAIGSSLVLMTLIGAIGFGGWTVLNEIQRVQMVPIENAPNVMSDLDPLLPSGVPMASVGSGGIDAASGVFAPPSDALDRLYRPQALDVPVLVARDAPISTLDPATVGSFVSPELTAAASVGRQNEAPITPRVVESDAPELALVAARPSWVRVQAANGTVIFEGIMNAGDSYIVPAMEEPPVLRAGDSGAVYFAMNGVHYGPVGERGSVTSNVALAVDSLSATYAEVVLQEHGDLARVVAEAQGLGIPQE